jgi:tight adherence protein B
MTAAVAGCCVGTTLWLLVGDGRRSARRLSVAPPASTGVVLGCAVATAAAMTALLGVPPLALAVVAVAGCALMGLGRRRARRRRAADAAADVVTLCFATSAELRAGRTPAEALFAAAGQLRVLHAAIDAAACAVARGAVVGEELACVAHDEHCPRLLPVAATWTATAATGSGSADVLERLGTAFERDDECRAELDALAAGPRATVLVLVLLPVFALGLGVTAGVPVLGVLLHTPVGWAAAALAAGLDACGAWWMRRMTAAALAS